MVKTGTSTRYRQDGFSSDQNELHELSGRKSRYLLLVVGRRVWVDVDIIFALGRKVSISKNDAQSCLCNMLKSDIPATLWRIALENPFNGD